MGKRDIFAKKARTSARCVSFHTHTEIEVIYVTGAVFAILLSPLIYKCFIHQGGK
jgi:hypothetical protein